MQEEFVLSPCGEKGAKTMKKMLCLLLCAAMVVSLAACAKSEPQKEVDLKTVAAEAVEELTEQGAMLIP